METLEGNFNNLYRLFGSYLHQDWTIEGETLSKVFEQNNALHEICKGIKQEAKLLLEKGYDNQFLDDIFFGQWGAGYEPEADGLDDWHHVLREIVRYCERYTEVE
ncbi:hypothetical protein GCM10009602_13220 [Nocardiopsis tropica]